MLGIHILEYNPPFRGVDRANVTSLKLHFKKLLLEMVLKILCWVIKGKSVTNMMFFNTDFN